MEAIRYDVETQIKKDIALCKDCSASQGAKNMLVFLHLSEDFLDLLKTTKETMEIMNRKPNVVSELKTKNNDSCNGAITI
ncbi:MAG: hypothetical protein ACQBVK_02405 [Candidatus Phytoplasma sp. TWB_XP]